MSELCPVQISALQHYVFCPRQCGLIHVAGIWAENILTAQGRVLHDRVDSGEPEKRKNILFERAVVVASATYGLSGKLDLLETDLATGDVVPVEYKRGRPKQDLSDLVQVCAQALCIEEMKGVAVTHGALWYWQTRHRIEVPIDQKLRDITLESVCTIRQMMMSGTIPQAHFEKKCAACSLYDSCAPESTGSDRTLEYVKSLYMVV